MNFNYIKIFVLVVAVSLTACSLDDDAVSNLGGENDVRIEFDAGVTGMPYFWELPVIPMLTERL